MTQPTRTAPRRDVGVNTVSYCKDCNYRWQGSNAAYDAIAHHEQTGHNIRVEQTIFWERKSVGSLQSAVGSPVQHPAT
jgi:predicted Rdx family selenoprotein